MKAIAVQFLRPRRGKPVIRVLPSPPLKNAPCTLDSTGFIGYHPRLPGLGDTLIITLRRPLVVDSLSQMALLWGSVAWNAGALIQPRLSPDGLFIVSYDILLPPGTSMPRHPQSVGYILAYGADEAATDRVQDTPLVPGGAHGGLQPLNLGRRNPVTCLCIPMEG